MKKISLILFLFFVSIESYGFSKRKPPVEKQVVEAPKKQSFKNLVFRSSMFKVLNDQKKFSSKAIEKAFKFLDQYKDDITKADSICLSEDNKRNRKKIRNQNCLVVADYTKTKKKPRMLLINPLTGESELFFTAHGKGSHNQDEIETGETAKRFSNRSGSNMTSLGFYLTDFLYTSKKDTFGPGPSNGLKLDGINCSNNNAKMRYIVMHTADYVPTVKAGSKDIGNSEGCVTFPEKRRDVLKKCKQGALVYAFYEKAEQRFY